MISRRSDWQLVSGPGARGLMSDLQVTIPRCYQIQVARQVVLLFYDHLMCRITYINVLIIVSVIPIERPLSGHLNVSDRRIETQL